MDDRTELIARLEQLARPMEYNFAAPIREASAALRADRAGVDDATAKLIHAAIRFSDWAAGEGLCPVDDNVSGPEDFFWEYSQETGDEDLETLADRVRSALSQPAAVGPCRDPLLEPRPEQPAQSGPKAPFRFTRFVDGIEMAEGVDIHRASSVAEAFSKARALYGGRRGMDLVLEIAPAQSAPHEDDAWTDEQHAAAIEVLTGRKPRASRQSGEPT